eukprot:538146-Amphidinium_carterae.1
MRCMRNVIREGWLRTNEGWSGPRVIPQGRDVHIPPQIADNLKYALRRNGNVRNGNVWGGLESRLTTDSIDSVGWTFV